MPIGKTYRDIVFELVRYVFLLGCAVGAIFSFAAIMDMLLHLGWGYPWTTIPGELLFSAASYVGAIFVRRISRATNALLD